MATNKESVSLEFEGAPLGEPQTPLTSYICSRLRGEVLQLFALTFAEAIKNDRHAEIILFETVYKFLGYDQYGHAVRQLKKLFPCIARANINLSCRGEVSSNHRGPSKDPYLISVRQFETLMLAAKTEEGANAREMMLDVKDAVQDYIKIEMEENKKNVLEQQKKIASLSANRMRHDFLKNSMIYAKESLVYLGKIKELDDGRTIYKFGETKDIQVRGNGLRFEHAELGELLLVDVWPCHRCKDFESFMLKHPSVTPHRCHEQVRGRNARELVYISSAFTLEQFRSLILSNICDFQGFTREQALEVRRIDLEERRIELTREQVKMQNKRLELIEATLGSITAPGLPEDVKSTLHKLATSLSDSTFRVQESTTTPPSVVVSDNDTMISDRASQSKRDNADAQNEPIFIPRQTDPCIQKYDSDLNLVAVYDTLRDAARQNGKAMTFEISRAVENNNIYLDHRWAQVDREQKDQPQVLPPTAECRRRVRDRVARIRGGIVVELFPDARAAATSLGMSKDAVTAAIAKKGGVLRDMLFKYWSQCTEDERASYEGDVEDVSMVTSAKQVRQLDPETGAVVKTWTNMQELVQAFKTSHKTINKKASDGSIFKGFRWQVTG